MKAERWNRLQEVFDAATERPRTERESFVAETCGDDDELRSDVLAMLSADESAGEFIETAVRGATTSFAVAEDPTRELTKFGKYEILSFIGEGGFSQVHKGRDPDLQREVAIKTCTSASRDLRKRFYREAKISAGLQHPNIVTVHDLGVENGIPFLVQEFLSGHDLATILARGTRITPSTAVDQLIQVARGLEYAHRKGVLHRDIKPSNVLALDSGRVKILDFGIARFLEEDNPLTDRGMPIGTAGYQSPEQLEGAELDRRTDVFSFGVLAYELIAAKRPFPGRTFAEVYRRVREGGPPPLRQGRRDCPPALEALVSSCLENDRNKRPKSFTAIIRELERIGAGLAPATRPGAHLGVLELQRQRRRRVLAAAAALAAASATIWILLAMRPDEPSVLSGIGDVPAATLSERSALPTPSPATVTSEVEAAESRPDVEEPGAVRPGSDDASTPVESPDPIARLAARPAGPAATPLAEPATARVDTRVLGDAAPKVAAELMPSQIDRSIREEAAPPVPKLTVPERSVPEHSVPERTVPELTVPEPTALESSLPESAAPTEPVRTVGPQSATDERSPIDTAGESSHPELIEPLTLDYPTRITPKERVLLEREESVQITLWVLVDERGQMLHASVLSTNEPGTAYRDAALESIQRARFRPGTRDGESTQMWTRLSLEYPLR